MRLSSLLLSLMAIGTLFVSGNAQAQGLRITTWMYDNSHTGQNLKETTLTPANVNPSSFSKLGAYAVDGQVYAQPLYWQALTIPGKGTYDVLFVVTESDGVYAFDADNPGTAALWYVNFTAPPNIVAVPCADIDRSCHVYPAVGITGSPVIDAATQTMYLVARTKEVSGSTTTYVQRLHALDITTGNEKFGGPVVITATIGSSSFDPQHSGQRPGLIMVPGSGGHSTIYIAWAAYSHPGKPLLPGWVMAYDSQTLQQLAVFDTTPNGTNGGVWGSGGGVVADRAGNIYIATADGTFDVNKGGADYGDSVVKLKLSGNTFTVLDYFTPKEQKCRSQYDYDLGSGSPMLLPHDRSAQTSDELVMAGKGGSPCDLFGSSYAAPIYVLNQEKLGHFSSTKDNVVQTVQGSPSGYWSAPAYWQGTSSKYVYYGGVVGDAAQGPGDHLKMWTLSGGLLSTAPVAQSAVIFEVGVTPAISANGSTNGILWAIERQDRLGFNSGTKPAVLHAYDATNVSTELYNSSQAGTRDQAGAGTKYVVPTVARGRVYIGTQTEVDVYGLTK